MENLLPLIFGIGCGIVTLLGWLWLSAEAELNKSRRELDSREAMQGKLLEELRSLKQAFLNRESRLHEVLNQDHDGTDQQHRLRGEIAEFHRKLEESQSRLCELERICEGLADGEPMRHALREENARHQAQSEHSLQGDGESGTRESRQLSVHQQYDELLTMQAALTEAQRRFHDALVVFAGLVDTPSKPVVQTPTFEVFRGRGAQTQPLSTGTASENRNPAQPTIQSDAPRQSGVIAKFRNLKAPKAS